MLPYAKTSLYAHRLSEQGQAEAKIIDLGMPLVISGWSRWRRAMQISGPLVAFHLYTGLFYYVTLLLASWMPGVDAITDGLDAQFDASDASIIAAFGALIGGLIFAVGLGWLLVVVQARLPQWASWIIPALALILSAATVPIVDYSFRNKSTIDDYLLGPFFTLAIALLLYGGFGSLARWATFRVRRELPAVGPMIARVLPVLLLTVLFFFFNAEIWQVAAGLNNARAWAVAGLIFTLAVLLVMVTLYDSFFRDLAEMRGSQPVKLARPLLRRERLNLLLIPVTVHVIQLVLFMALITGFFVVFGYFFIAESTLRTWVGAATRPAIFWGWRLPVSRQLLQVSLMLGAFSGLSFAAATVSDQGYRDRFLGQILSEVSHLRQARDEFTARYR